MQLNYLNAFARLHVSVERLRHPCALCVTRLYQVCHPRVDIYLRLLFRLEEVMFIVEGILQGLRDDSVILKVLRAWTSTFIRTATAQPSLLLLLVRLPLLLRSLSDLLLVPEERFHVVVSPSDETAQSRVRLLISAADAVACVAVDETILVCLLELRSSPLAWLRQRLGRGPLSVRWTHLTFGVLRLLGTSAYILYTL